MVITFPQLGSMHVFCKAIAETAGIEYCLPPPTTDKTREIGEFYTNESVCLPLKVILGNFIQALQLGADTIIMVGSGPPCRLGMYDRIMKIILRDLGFSFRWLTIPGMFNWQALLQNKEETKPLKKELSKAQIIAFPKALSMGWKKMRWCEYLEDLALSWRAVALDPFEVDSLLAEGMRSIDEAKNFKTLNKAGLEAARALNDLQCSDKKPFQVVLTGEVYTVMEPSINMDIERRLGYKGVKVHRSSYFSTHIRKGSRIDRRLLRQRKQLLQLASPYFKYDVGAECNFSVAETVKAANEGFDGSVHVYPFSCMPETNAACVLSTIGPELGIPVLSLPLDRKDMGIRLETQIEAFVDIMQMQREGKI